MARQVKPARRVAMGEANDRPGSRAGVLAGGTAAALAGRSLPGPGELAAGALTWLARQWRREEDERRLFLWLPACFGLGIIVYFAAPSEPVRWAPFAGAVLLGAVAWRARARAGDAAGLVGMAAMAGAMLFAGLLAAGLRTDRVAAPVFERPRSGLMTAWVEAVDIRTNGGRLLLQPVTMAGIEAGRLPFRVRVTTPNRPAVQAGDFVSLQVRLMPPPEASRPGGYDFAREAFFAGIGAIGSASGPIALAPPPGPPGWRLSFAAAVDRARNELTLRIVRAIGGASGAVAASLVTGKRGLIPERTNDDLRAAGIYHVVSISGLHMVLAAGMVFWAVRALLALWPAFVLRWPVKKIAALAGVAAAFAYNIFAGSEIATERSLVMTVVLLGAILVDRPALSMRNLAIAALVVLAMEPESLLGPSFQMSFAAVAGLIAVFERPGRAAPQPEALGLSGLLAAQAPATVPPPRGPVLTHAVAAARHVGLALLTTLVAEAATAPFALYHFQRIAPFGIAGNTLTLPLVSFVVMPAAFIGVIAIPFGWDDIVWKVMGLGVEGMLRISAIVAGWPGAGGAWHGFSAAALLLLSLAILCATLWRSGLRWSAVPIAAAATMLALREPLPVLNVTPDGQGVLARLADGHLAVVGRRPSSFALEQWLRAAGDSRGVEDQSLFAGARCDSLGCTAKLADGRRVAHVVAAGAFEEDCLRADILVTPLRAPAFCRPPVLLDRRVLSATGAVTLLETGLDGAPRIARQSGPTEPALSEARPANDPGGPTEWDSVRWPEGLVTQRTAGTDRPWTARHRTSGPAAATKNAARSAQSGRTAPATPASAEPDAEVQEAPAAAVEPLQ